MNQEVKKIQKNYFEEAIKDYRIKFGLDGAYNPELIKAESMLKDIIAEKEIPHSEKESVLGKIVFAVGHCFTELYSEDDIGQPDDEVKHIVSKMDEMMCDSPDVFESDNLLYIKSKMAEWQDIIKDIESENE